MTVDLLNGLSFSAEDIATLSQLGEYRGKPELFARQRPEVIERGPKGKGLAHTEVSVKMIPR